MGRSAWMRIGALALAVIVAAGLLVMLWNITTPSTKVLGPGISVEDQPETPTPTPSASPTPKPSPSTSSPTPKPSPSTSTPPRNNVVTPLPPQRGYDDDWDDDDWDDDDWDDDDWDD